MSTERTISEEAARAIWRRAAHLQAQAERRAEERARLAPAEDGKTNEPHDGGFFLGDVEVAAAEAGISPEYVRIAVAEIGEKGKLPPLPSWEDTAANLMMGEAEHSIEQTCIIPASLDTATGAVIRAFSGHPCLLRPRDVVELPSNGGRVVVFEVPKYDWSATANPPFVEKAYMCGLTVLHVILRPLANDEGSTEVVVSGDLHAGRRSTWRWAAVTSGATGAIGGAVGVGLGPALTLSGGFLALPVLAGFVAVAGLTSRLWGWSFRYYANQAEELIKDTLSHIALQSPSLSKFSSHNVPRDETRLIDSPPRELPFRQR